MLVRGAISLLLNETRGKVGYKHVFKYKSGINISGILGMQQLDVNLSSTWPSLVVPQLKDGLEILQRVVEELC